MQIDIIILDKKNAGKSADIKKLLMHVGEAMNLFDACVEVYIADDAVMEEIAKKTGHAHEGGINVLSFPAHSDFPRPDLETMRDLGEIYINPSYIERAGENMNHMVIHAFLHLMGYGHEKKHDTLRMKKKEKELLTLIIKF